MAALNFPSSPTVGQTYTENSRSWTWTGTSWAATTTADDYYTKIEADARYDEAGAAVALSIALG